MHQDRVFKALADPTRRAILKMLRGGEMTAGEIASRFEISGPSMSHHFNVLKHADLVYVRREGQLLYYALNTTVFQDMLTTFMELFGSHDGATERAVHDDVRRRPDSGAL